MEVVYLERRSVCPGGASRRTALRDDTIFFVFVHAVSAFSKGQGRKRPADAQ